MPTGYPKTPAEKAAEELLAQIVKNAHELARLVADGGQAQVKLDRARRELSTLERG